MASLCLRSCIAIAFLHTLLTAYAAGDPEKLPLTSFSPVPETCFIHGTKAGIYYEGQLRLFEYSVWFIRTILPHICEIRRTDYLNGYGWTIHWQPHRAALVNYIENEQFRVYLSTTLHVPYNIPDYYTVQYLITGIKQVLKFPAVYRPGDALPDAAQTSQRLLVLINALFSLVTEEVQGLLQIELDAPSPYYYYFQHDFNRKVAALNDLSIAASEAAYFCATDIPAVLPLAQLLNPIYIRIQGLNRVVHQMDRRALYYYVETPSQVSEAAEDSIETLTRHKSKKFWEQLRTQQLQALFKLADNQPRRLDKIPSVHEFHHTGGRRPFTLTFKSVADFSQVSDVHVILARTSSPAQPSELLASSVKGTLDARLEDADQSISQFFIRFFHLLSPLFPSTLRKAIREHPENPWQLEGYAFTTLVCHGPGPPISPQLGEYLFIALPGILEMPQRITKLKTLNASPIYDRLLILQHYIVPPPKQRHGTPAAGHRMCFANPSLFDTASQNGAQKPGESSRYYIQIPQLRYTQHPSYFIWPLCLNLYPEKTKIVFYPNANKAQKTQNPPKAETKSKNHRMPTTTESVTSIAPHSNLSKPSKVKEAKAAQTHPHNTVPTNARSKSNVMTSSKWTPPMHVDDVQNRIYAPSLIDLKKRVVFASDVESDDESLMPGYSSTSETPRHRRGVKSGSRPASSALHHLQRPNPRTKTRRPSQPHKKQRYRERAESQTYSSSYDYSDPGTRQPEISLNSSPKSPTIASGYICKVSRSSRVDYTAGQMGTFVRVNVTITDSEDWEAGF